MAVIVAVAHLLATASSAMRRLSLPKLAFVTFAFAPPWPEVVMLTAPLSQSTCFVGKIIVAGLRCRPL